MTQQFVNNGDSGLDARTKWNDNFTEVYGSSPTMTKRIITLESDLPTPTVGSNGFMVHLLEKNIEYDVQVPVLSLTTPIEYPSTNSTALELVTISSNIFPQILYSGTDPLFSGKSCVSVRLSFPSYISLAGAKLFELEGNVNSMPSFDLSLCSFIGFSDLGNVNDFFQSASSQVNFINYTEPLKFHNMLLTSWARILSEKSALPPSSKPFLVYTGTSNIINFEIIADTTLQAGESVISLDSGINLIGTSTLKEASFIGLPGTTYFELDKSGSITAFADLSVLITGTATDIVDDGNGFAQFTQTAHGHYVGLTINQSGTANNNGNQIVTKIIDINTYVTDSTFVSPESGSFSNTGVGVRVTTSTAHNLSDNRTTVISGTTNYNFTETILNTTSTTFDTSRPFVADDATGSFLTQSLNESTINVNSQDNGAQKDSQSAINTFITTGFTIPINTIGVYEDVDGAFWDSIVNERFSESATGLITYNGIRPINIRIVATATISKVGGGTDQLALALNVNGTDFITETISTTENATPTNLSVQFLITLLPGQTVKLRCANLGSTSDIVFDSANITIK